MAIIMMIIAVNISINGVTAWVFWKTEKTFTKECDIIQAISEPPFKNIITNNNPTAVA